MTEITRFDTYSTSSASHYKHRNSIGNPIPRNHHITTFIYFQIRDNSKHRNQIIFLSKSRSSDANLTHILQTEWATCSHCSPNRAILHYQLTDKTVDKGAYDARSASETDCANLFEELEIHMAKVYLKDYLNL